VFNISAMSFRRWSPNAIRALNRGAKEGGFVFLIMDNGKAD